MTGFFKCAAIAAMTTFVSTQAAQAVITYTFDTASSFTALEGGAFDFNPTKPNFRFDFGTPAGTASHGATFASIGGNGAVQVSEAFNFATNGSGGNAYTIDLFPAPAPTNITNIAFDIRLDPASAKDLFGGAGFFQVIRRDDNYTFTDTGFNEEFGNPTFNAPTTGTYEHISIALPAAGVNVRALTLQLFNDANRQINGNVIFDIDNIVLSQVGDTTPEPASLGLLGVGAMALLRRRRA